MKLKLDALQKLTSFEDNRSTPNELSTIPLPSRPATLCSGCPHRASYYAAREAINSLNLDLESIHPSDIGC